MNAGGRLALGSFGLLWLLAAPLTAQKHGGVAAGGAAPEFALLTLAGDTATLAAQRGHPVVISFWASWCLDCRTEMPELAAEQSRYAADSLRILAINLTDQESLRHVRKFVASLQIPFPIPLDRKSRVSRAYGVIWLPATVLVDRQGIVRFVQNGPMPAKLLDSRLRELVAMP